MVTGWAQPGSSSSNSNGNDELGIVSSETEQHLKHEFRTLGRDASDSALVAAVGSEIDRLSREAETLRKLRAVLFGVA